MKKRIILSWWGSIFNGGETAGDITSLLVIIENLIKNDIEFDVLSKRYYEEIEPYVVNEENLDANNYSTFLFICGPLIKDSIELNNLINKFSKIQKIAIGVSILNKSWNVFDHVFSREGENDLFFDLSIMYNHNKLIEKQKNTYALCLRGKQREYGIENCYSDTVDDYVNSMKNIRFDTIDTRLDKKKLDYKIVYESIATKSLLITTRFHGSLFAVHSGVPFIAIDQIDGNGKIYNFFSKLGWEYVYKYNSIDAVSIEKLINKVKEKPNIYNDSLLEIKKILFTNTEIILNKMVKLL